jgi:hypothetical protein
MLRMKVKAVGIDRETLFPVVILSDEAEESLDRTTSTWSSNWQNRVTDKPQAGTLQHRSPGGRCLTSV